MKYQCKTLNKFADVAPCYETFVELVMDRSQRSPDKTIFTFLADGEREAGSLTYSRLDQIARAVAVEMRTRYRVGDTVLLLFQPGLESITGFFGCLYAGIIAVPVFPPLRHMDRLNSIIDDCGAKGILTTSNFQGMINDWLHENLERGLDLTCTAIDRIGESQGSFWKPPKISEQHLAFLQYTSGSTGAPKGVMVSHRNLIYNSELLYLAHQVTEETVSVSWLPPYHDMGLIDGILQPLYSATPTYLMSPRSFLKKPVRWLNAISKYRATQSGGPCFAYDHCVNKIIEQQKAQLDLSSWDCAYNGAEPINQSVLDRFYQAFAETGFKKRCPEPVYGMAEATLFVTSSGKHTEHKTLRVDSKLLGKNIIHLEEGREKASQTLVGCGSPWGDTQIAIVDPVTLRASGKQQVGEIWIAGSSVCEGYWKKPELSEQTFKANYIDEQGMQQGPFLRTGDLGYLQDDNLFVTGRIKDLIIIHGRNHYPQDIEHTVWKSQPGLRANACSCLTIDREGKQSLVIAQEIDKKTSAEFGFQPVERSIVQAISEIHGISVFDVVLLKPGSIPKTSSGKIQRYKTKELYLTGAFARLNHALAETTKISPRTVNGAVTGVDPLARKLENRLVFQIAEQLDLDIDCIDKNQSFQSMGLDSVSILEIAVEAEKIIGVTIPDDAVFKYPTIKEMALYAAQCKYAHLEAKPKNDATEINIASKGDELRKATFAIPEFEFE